MCCWCSWDKSELLTSLMDGVVLMMQHLQSSSWIFKWMIEKKKKKVLNWACHRKHYTWKKGHEKMVLPLWELRMQIISCTWPPAHLHIVVHMSEVPRSKSSSVGLFAIFSSMLKSQLNNLHLTSSTLTMLNQNKIPFLAPGSTPNITLIVVVPCGWDLASEGLDFALGLYTRDCQAGSIRKALLVAGSLSVVCFLVNKLVYWLLQLLRDSAYMCCGPTVRSTDLSDLCELSTGTGRLCPFFEKLCGFRSRRRQTSPWILKYKKCKHVNYMVKYGYRKQLLCSKICVKWFFFFLLDKQSQSEYCHLQNADLNF